MRHCPTLELLDKQLPEPRTPLIADRYCRRDVPSVACGFVKISQEAESVILRKPLRRTLARFFLATLPLVLGFLALSGCEDAYSVDIRYPLRTDWMIEKPPTLQPTRYNPPGILPLYVLDHADTTLFGPDRGQMLAERDEKNNIFDPRALSNETKELVSLSLRELSGRPRHPKIDLNGPKFDELNDKLTKQLKLDRKTLSAGGKLYRRHCLHCHGIAGDGKGPTGAWVNPPPRDYRQGIFKFTSSAQAQGERKPRRDDLKRVLLNGIEGTSMPSFHLLSAEEVEALVSYVIHLSIRGQAEYVTVLDLVKEDKDRKANKPTDENTQKVYERIRENAQQIAEQWLKAQESEIKPVKIPEYKSEDDRIAAAARGFRVFSIKEQGGCIQCHLNLGRDAQFFYDAWGTVVRPRNIYSNQLRGGRRPIDLYWRIHAGINGAGMPALITSEADLQQKEDWIWDLVSFVQLAPYRDKRVAIQAKLDEMQKNLPAGQPLVKLPID